MQKVWKKRISLIKKKEEDDEPKLTTSDKINIKLNKALTTKKDPKHLLKLMKMENLINTENRQLSMQQLVVV